MVVLLVLLLPQTVSLGSLGAASTLVVLVNFHLMVYIGWYLVNPYVQRVQNLYGKGG